MESRELGACALLGRTGDKISKTQKTRVNMKQMFLDGEITLPRLQRSMGALYSKVNSLKKKKQAVSRAGGLVEDEERRHEGQAAAVDPNTRAILASITEEVEERGRGPRQGASRGRRGNLENGRNGRELGTRGGRGRETGVRGWEAAGPNKRKCLYCGGVFSIRYMYTHLRELCWGRANGEDEQEQDDESVGSKEESVVENEEENVNLDEIFEEVEDLGKNCFWRRKSVSKKKRKASN